MTNQPWLWGFLIFHEALNTFAQFMSPPGLPFPFPPQMPDGSPMPQMPPLPPMPMPPGPQQLPMPMSMPMHQPRIPMVVMPYYKNDKSRPKYTKKKRRAPKRHIEDSSSDSEHSDSASHDFEFRSKKKNQKNRRHQVLTPVVSYITKDGYVVYQKKIKKERAKDWLEIGKKKNSAVSREESGELLEDVKHRLRRAKKRNRDD